MKRLAIFLLLGLVGCSRPVPSLAPAAGRWQTVVWRFTLTNSHPCAVVVRQPSQHYSLQIQNDADQTMFTENYEFATDEEMMKFVEEVCRKREQK